MYNDFKNYPHLKKLPDEIEDALKFLKDSRELKEAFGEDVINSYIKLKNMEIDDFFKYESFDKKTPVTDWEKNSTLDC
jgi:glutamine synthetase